MDQAEIAAVCPTKERPRRNAARHNDYMQ